MLHVSGSAHAHACVYVHIFWRGCSWAADVAAAAVLCGLALMSRGIYAPKWWDPICCCLDLCFRFHSSPLGTSLIHMRIQCAGWASEGVLHMF